MTKQTSKMKEERFEKVVEGNSNIVWILGCLCFSMFVFIAEITQWDTMSKGDIIWATFIEVTATFFIAMLIITSNRKVYWRKIK